MIQQATYTIDQAAQKLGTNQRHIFDLALKDNLRMGVYARGWWGVWNPLNPDDSEDIDSLGVCDIDTNGTRTFAKRLSDGTLVKLKETYICQFWYIHGWALYELLASHQQEPMEIDIFEPIDPHYLAQEHPDRFTSKGFFWVHKSDDRNPSKLIGIEDLLILDTDLDEISEFVIDDSDAVVCKSSNAKLAESLQKFLNEFLAKKKADDPQFKLKEEGYRKKHLLAAIEAWEKDREPKKDLRLWCKYETVRKFWSSAERKQLIGESRRGRIRDDEINVFEKF